MFVYKDNRIEENKKLYQRMPGNSWSVDSEETFWDNWKILSTLTHNLFLKQDLTSDPFNAWALFWLKSSNLQELENKQNSN